MPGSSSLTIGNWIWRFPGLDCTLQIPPWLNGHVHWVIWPDFPHEKHLISLDRPCHVGQLRGVYGVCCLTCKLHREVAISSIDFLLFLQHVQRLLHGWNRAVVTLAVRNARHGLNGIVMYSLWFSIFLMVRVNIKCIIRTTAFG